MIKILKDKYKIDINDYEIIKKINQGGFGIIYLVKNKSTKEELVAKVSLVDTGGSNSRHNQFVRREIGILMRVQHPTIIPFRGFSFNDFNGNNNITILMDYMEEGSLSSLLDKESKGLCSTDYNNTKRQIILTGIARGMMILHSKNVIHRDLSTGNILLDKNFHPLITDFGLSKFFDPQNSKNQTLTESGTVVYMAPEVIETSEYDIKADVYSFGIIMYEVITGMRAYSDLLLKQKMTQFQLKNKIVNGLRPTFNTPIKEGLKNMIQQCLLQNPNERPTFNELFNKLSLSQPEELLTEDDEEKYLLDDIDLDEFVEYIEEITEDTDISNKLMSIEKAHKEEINSLKETIRSQSNEIKILRNEITSLKSKSIITKGGADSPSSSQIGNFFYVNSSPSEPGILHTLKKIEIDHFHPLFIPSQSHRDIYQLINPNTTTFFGTYKRAPDFFIEFHLEKSVTISGMIIYTHKSRFPKSFKILIDGNVVKSISEATELNEKLKSMTINFSPTNGSCVRFVQTGPNWENGNVLFIKRFELLSPEEKYRKNGVFSTLIEESENKDPRKSKVWICATSFDLNSIHLTKSNNASYCDGQNAWFQVELTHGSAILTGFRIARKSLLKSYKVIATDDNNKPIESWTKLFEINEEDNKKILIWHDFLHPSPLVRFVRIVTTGPDWEGKNYLHLSNFDMFGYYF